MRGRGLRGRARPLESVVFRAGTVRAKIDLLDFADHPAAQVVNRHHVAGSGSVLGPELGHQTGLIRRFREGTDLRDVVAHRFLAINVFACPHRSESNRGMHVIGNREVDRIDLRALGCNEFAPIPVNPHIGCHLAGGFEVVGIDVTERHHFGPGVRQEIRQVDLAHPTHADARMLEFSVFFRRLSAGESGNDHWHGESCGGGPEESSAGNGWNLHGGVGFFSMDAGGISRV